MTCQNTRAQNPPQTPRVNCSNNRIRLISPLALCNWLLFLLGKAITHYFSLPLIITANVASGTAFRNMTKPCVHKLNELNEGCKKRTQFSQFNLTDERNEEETFN